jgi:hypothetical protein
LNCFEDFHYEQVKCCMSFACDPCKRHANCKELLRRI